MAESTKIALLANIHNGIYKEVRFEKRNPEAPMILGEMRFQNGWWSGEVQVKVTNST
ncbi:MAG: hypothetical protein AAGH46_00140 [Bacteroidota bacterium]